MEKFQRRVIITVGIGFLLVLSFFVITEAITKYTGFSVSIVEDDFEKCLEEQDITLYLNSEDISASLDNIELDSYLKYFKIFNCNIDNKVCVEKGIDSFPSWIVNENLASEDIDLDKLAEFSGCKLIV